MGMFDFLKKSKTETSDMGMELPPVPKMDEQGFPDIKKKEGPELPDTSLPPLPSDVPGEIPPAPEKPKEEVMEAPKTELPEPPKTEESHQEGEEEYEIAEPPTDEEIPSEKGEEQAEEDTPSPEEIKKVMGKVEAEMGSKAEFPSIPEKAGDDNIPDRIPPLEGLPEAPDFSAEPRIPARVNEEYAPEPEQGYAPEMPKAIEPEEHPVYFAPEEPAAPQRKGMQGPLYIRSDRFKAVLDDIEQIRAKFKEEEDFFLRINDIKSAQDQKFEGFKKTLEDVQRKLLFIDRTLFEAK